MSYYLKYFTTWQNLGYHLLVSPFRFILSGEDCHPRVYKFHTSKRRQVCCALVHILLLYEAAAKIYTTYHKTLNSRSKNIASLVYSSQTFTGPILPAIFMYTMWFKQLKLVEFVQIAQTIQFPQSHSMLVTELQRIKILKAFIMASFFIRVLADEFYKIAIFEGNLIGYLKSFAKEAENIFFIPEPFTSSQFMEEEINYYYSSYILHTLAWTLQGTIHFILTLPTYYSEYYITILMLIEPIAFRHALIDLLKLCRGCSLEPINYSQILWYYGQIKSLITIANESFGYYFLTLVVFLVPYYPIWLGIFFFHLESEYSWKYFTSWFAFIVHGTSLWIILILCAEINAKAGEFYAWISNKVCEDSIIDSRFTQSSSVVVIGIGTRGSQKGINPPSPIVMTALNMDMNTHSIALKGMGFFSMTYGFLGTVVGVVLTYAIIVVQFQLQKQVVS